MSADLDALDRGVVDAGITAAEAVARVEVLEKRVADMERAFALMSDYRARPPARLPARERAARSHLTLVKP